MAHAQAAAVQQRCRRPRLWLPKALRLWGAHGMHPFAAARQLTAAPAATVAPPRRHTSLLQDSLPAEKREIARQERERLRLQEQQKRDALERLRAEENQSAAKGEVRPQGGRGGAARGTGCSRCVPSIQGPSARREATLWLC